MTSYLNPRIFYLPLDEIEKYYDLDEEQKTFFKKETASLLDLRGHVSAVYTGHLFDLVPEKQQEQIARGLAGLLSPEPGYMIIGVQGGRFTKGFLAQTDPISGCSVTHLKPETGRNCGRGYSGRDVWRSRRNLDRR
ncbi:hypothetical protein BT96DRAFT_978630 [Gymnopus androsaceus JB14]|uniref:Uncharacterized protein n=1 Tax=Gymnopus androsaceus JB14 TaxID=1447944 RepID=A0A6A4H8X0_9AGAR|nr:hypothetical protein BT96DRAFT_978630 [Gymnopus androsaceus JB14]